MFSFRQNKILNVQIFSYFSFSNWNKFEQSVLRQLWLSYSTFTSVDCAKAWPSLDLHQVEMDNLPQALLDLRGFRIEKCSCMRTKWYMRCGVWERTDVMGDDSDINVLWKNRKWTHSWPLRLSDILSLSLLSASSHEHTILLIKKSTFGPSA